MQESLTQTSNLSHLVDIVRPNLEWRVLMIAGDEWRIAFDLAPHVNYVTLVCPTAEQAREVDETAAKLHLKNINCGFHDPEYLPYADHNFDLLVCHHMAHRLHDVKEWLPRVTRILQPQGLIALTTYLVPGTRLRGKKARKLGEAGDYLKAFFQLHDTKHQKYYSQNGWEDLLIRSGFDIRSVETADKQLDFAQWVDEFSLTSKDQLRLKAMLIQAPEKAREFLTTQFSGDRIRFRLPEFTILATSKANTD